MPHNFLNSNLLPKIIKKPLSSENYEAENLISSQFINKTRGFIGFPSVKPPADLEFEFICNVNIHYVFLNTTLGSQKCSGIELLAKTSPNSAFVSLSKVSYSEDGIFFCNKKKYSKESPPPNYSSNYYLAFFKSDTFRIFLNACAIKIVIFRTEKSVPCLACAEVWGEPSTSCSKMTKDTISRIIQKSLPQVETNSNPQAAEKFKVPEDFKDNLTFEIMTIPMTMPSGKTVDQSTLEKHIENEASFGRKPCDPFTGVKFTDSLKPVLNVGLKSRIDMFLLENSHRSEFFNLKRTVGKQKYESLGEPSSADKRLRVDVDKYIPNFYSFTSEKNVSSLCNLCKSELHNFYYKIPCHHRYCRPCLLKICNDLNCLVCKTPFSKKNVAKINK